MYAPASCYSAHDSPHTTHANAYTATTVMTSQKSSTESTSILMTSHQYKSNSHHQSQYNRSDNSPPHLCICIYLCLPDQALPPYNGFGSLEDSKQSCLSLVPQPPKKDFIKMLENDGKVLRFAAVMVSSTVIVNSVTNTVLVCMCRTLHELKTNIASSSSPIIYLMIP